MQTFKLPSGHTVSTERKGVDVEFTTRGADGNVISTVQHSFAEAVPLLRKMACITR